MDKKFIIRLSKRLALTLCLGLFFSVKTTDAIIRVGDIVKIENISSSWGESGLFLAEDSSGKAKVASSGYSAWAIRRDESPFGTVITSGTFPKLQNAKTGKYLLGAGNPISMGSTTYSAGEIWTPVDIPRNSIANIDKIVNAFRNPLVGYPNQYTYVLYSGLKGQGKTPPYPTPAPPSTIPDIPIINTTVDYDRMIAFVSSLAQILGEDSGNARNVTNIGSNPRNLWFIRQTAGSSSFIFDPNLFGNKRVLYSENWGSDTVNNIEVKFQAAAANDINVQFAPSIHSPGESCALLNIGGFSNTKTWVGNGLLNGEFPSTGHTVYGTQISDRIPSGTNWFWIKLSGTSLTYGQSSTVGQNQKGSFTIPATMTGFKYVALGGYNARVTFRDISVKSIDPNDLTTLENLVNALNSVNVIGAQSDSPWPAKKTLFAIINNDNLNYDIFQDLNGGNDIYNKINAFYAGRTESTVSALRNLLEVAKTKAFLTNAQKENLIIWIENLGTAIDLVTNKNALNNALNAIGTSYTSAKIGTATDDWDKESRSMFAIIKFFNNALYQGANGGNSIYGKLQDFYSNRVRAAQSDLIGEKAYYEKLKELFSTVANTYYLFLTNAAPDYQYSNAASWPDKLEVNIALSSIGSNIGEPSHVWPTNPTMLAVINSFDSSMYTGINGGDYIFEKIKNLFDTRISATKNQLQVLLEVARGKMFFTDEQKSTINSWLMTVSQETGIPVTQEVVESPPAVGETPPVTAPLVEEVQITPEDINKPIIKEIKQALKNKTVSQKIRDLSRINSKYKKTEEIMKKTQNEFAAAIMKAGGNFIYQHLRKNSTYFNNFLRSMKKRPDRDAILNVLKPIKNALGNDLKKYLLFLNAALGSNLLTGPETKPKTQKYFVKKILIKFVEQAIELEQLYINIREKRR
jgi:hypothetical protein